MPGNKALLGWLASAGAVSALAFALVVGNGVRSAPAVLLLEVSSNHLPADGFSTARLVARAPDGRALPASGVMVEVVEGAQRARIESVTPRSGGVEAVVRAGILPGPVVVEARAPGFAPAQVRLETALDASDRSGDGTPDFLRLDTEADQQAFRHWFTFLAEAQFYRSPDQLASEINDCAALLRFAYREALREHDGTWATELDLPTLPGAPAVEKYHYPFTPLGAGLFRVAPGSFRPQDVGNGAFAQFADARTLQRLNTHFISRDIRRAQPGDLLFFRQLEQEQPFHAMVFLGPSQFEPGPQAWLLYHTGPLAGGPGEIRRVTVAELLRHPSPRWRPLPANPNFLGVYRWNILRAGE